jgi:excisionase family DNA binding protein
MKIDKKEAMRRLMTDLAVKVDTAALVLGIDRKVAYTAVKDGKLPSIRIGRLIRIPTAALRKLLDIPAQR